MNRNDVLAPHHGRVHKVSRRAYMSGAAGLNKTAEALLGVDTALAK